MSNPLTSPVMQSQLLHSSTPDGDSGITSAVRSFAGSAAGYFDARLQLAKLEGAEALRLGISVVAIAAALVTSALIAYVFGMISLTLWIADRWWEGSVMKAALVISSVHLMLGLAAVTMILLLTKGRRPFHATLKEFSEDRQWLKGNQAFKN